ncbi:hypothetical protein BGX28_009353 [Mortierella sp. GBA30]|nr:hypothetical protein BGX28_009353 [Mortierella sp. GBA30]
MCTVDFKDDRDNPFLVSGTFDATKTSERKKTSEVMEQEPTTASQGEDKLQPEEDQLSTDESYQVSRSPTMTPTRNKTIWSIIYNTGDGVLHYPSSWQSPWIVDGVNIADLLWDYRRSVVAALPNLDAPIEPLLSHLFSSLGKELWDKILSVKTHQRISPKAVQDVFEAAHNMSNSDYTSARKWIMEWQGGDLDVKTLMTNMLSTSALWDVSRDNEAGLIKKKFDPFFLTFICPMKHMNSFWDMTFPPSKRRKSMDPTIRGQRPDFFVRAVLPGLQCHLFTVEVKKSAQGLVVQSDLEKLACEMRDAIDDLANQKINISSVKVFGMAIA